ncbi:MAG: hypothetical protein ACE5G0_20370 [Rhodothermales bacterium]
MGMVWRGHDLSFTQPEREGHVEDLSAVQDVHAKKREMGFPLWGADKTWLAPQTRWTDGVPFLDLDSGPYDVSVERAGPETAVVRMTSQVCRETGVQITRSVAVSSGTHEWIVTHRLLNASSTEIQWGVWDVNMVLRPGKVFLPRRTDSQYPKGVKTFVEEGESVQVRDKVVSELGNLAVITCRESKAFKFGVDAQEGWVLAVVEVAGLGLVGYRKQVPVYRDKPYGHGCVAEVYNSDRYPYFEMEIHGPVVSLKPGASFELEERQALFDLSRWPQSEDEVRQHLERRS